MHVREGQVTPYHFHAVKVEDIINRGGAGAGRLLLKLYMANPEGDALSEEPFTVLCDGVARSLRAGAEVILGPGESITLPPRLFHQFYAIDGDALIGEVSSINDDDGDNYFLEDVGRYPGIEEDEEPYRLLCTEYARTATLA
jgi:hypothetical protein